MSDWQNSPVANDYTVDELMVLGPFGQECDLRRHGLKLAARGDKIAKRRAVVAVARKLAVLMHSLWKNNSPYDPDYQLRSTGQLAA